MGCTRCSRRSKKRGSQVGITAPEIVPDFSTSSPTVPTIRLGDGKTYSVASPLVKMRPVIGWSLWISVSGHKHFIEGNSPQGVINAIIDRYNLNDIEVTPLQVWYNANKVWVAATSPNHSYATVKDLKAIEESTVDPLIWDSENWTLALSAINAEEYDATLAENLIKGLIEIAGDSVTGCEVCYDDLVQNLLTDYSVQDTVQEWIETRYTNIVEANA